jgi:hypothetical protein
MTGIVFDCVPGCFDYCLAFMSFYQKHFQLSIFVDLQKKIVPIVHNIANIIQRREG